jgi:hypothetical protein
MLDSAAHIIELAHERMMTGSDKQLGFAPELALRLAGVRQDQPVDAAAVLVYPVENIRDRASLGINMNGAEQPPMAA